MTKILFESTKKDLYIEKLYILSFRESDKYWRPKAVTAVKYVLDYRLLLLFFV